MNRDYRLTAFAHNLVIDTTHGDDLRFAITITFNASICLTDLNAMSPVAAQAANNIVRCSLAGAGLAFL
ncbi:hypothetical protein N7517_002698 [Penicillium concentricum]|uniref:Uncharacterized protein n=1 Tax=Penicillium concentricum TaxID=293559 RepID=A0A9W9SUU4_9EURO|nr:uncharacterized protein N7517_002698 [Penicillium concentricum]KAJ5384787.1 hypothetical protein N7517_002698 [Penicillium concentricum]